MDCRIGARIADETPCDFLAKRVKITRRNTAICAVNTGERKKQSEKETEAQFKKKKKKTRRCAIRKLRGKVLHARYSEQRKNFSWIIHRPAAAMEFPSCIQRRDRDGGTEPTCISPLMDSEGREIKSNRENFISDGLRLKTPNGRKKQKRRKIITISYISYKNLGTLKLFVYLSSLSILLSWFHCALSELMLFDMHKSTERESRWKLNEGKLYM